MKVYPDIEKISNLYEMKKHHEGIIEIKNFIAPEECQKAIEVAKTITEEDWSKIYLESVKNLAKYHYNEDDYQKLIDNETIFINPGIVDKVARANTEEQSHRWVNALIGLFKNSDLIIPLLDSFLNIQRHYTGSQFDYHVDSEGFDGKADSNVVYTAVIYFNDDYNGGELDFPHQEVTFKPSAGSLVIFNSSPEFLHGVKEIKEGPTRYAATCFIREKGE